VKKYIQAPFIKYPYLTTIAISFLIIIGIYIYYPYQQRREILSIYSHLDQNPLPMERKLPPKDDQEFIRILAIDGGGVYGILPAHILKYIEEKSKKPVSELFDVIMGTSTGALLSVLLTIPGRDNKPRYSANDAINIYRKDGKKIFYNPWYHRILTLNGVLGPKYLTSERYNVFKFYLGETYFDQLTNNMIIPAYGVREHSPLLFVNWKQQGLLDTNFTVSDLLMGAVSPPGYFPSVVFGSEKNQYVLVDGGLFANNPSLAAVLIAMKVYPNKKYILVSLGTGKVKGEEIPPGKQVGWGDLQWSEEILSVLLDSGMKFDQLLLEKAFPFPLEIYYFNTEISGFKKILDDISPLNLLRLNKEGHQFVQTNRKRLNILVPRLLRP
jgi:uncharacterized protein